MSEATQQCELMDDAVPSQMLAATRLHSRTSRAGLTKVPGASWDEIAGDRQAA